MKSNLKERISISKSELLRQEEDFIVKRHIERYSLVRQFLNGTVVDFGCGCGYGSYLMSLNPDVGWLYGYDHDPEVIKEAKQEYQHENLMFLNSLDSLKNIGTVVALEVIEHLEDPRDLVKICDKLDAERIIVSYPTKKTTHYNPYHFHDFTEDDIKLLFWHYNMVKAIDLWNECRILIFERMWL